MSEIADKLIDWYGVNGRDLPWRRTRDPYRIWLSEVILQPTRIAQGMDYYLRFVARFPDVGALAAADEDEVLKLWQGLGYYSRARNLHAAARQVVERYGGRFPAAYADVRALNGVGDYTACTISVSLFISPVMTLINFMEQYQNGVTGFQRFLEIMDAQPEQDAPGAVDIGRAEGHIEFLNVTYSYDNGAEVLKNLSLDVKQGEKFALVGPSGGGKTTICHLIPHFYDIQQGTILIDGRDISTITRASLRRNIGIVQQDIYLFNASVRDNILYGRLDATEEEVREAAKRANIHDYIMSMENGYDTIIGERGVRLSGGQKQRLSIARVFLKNPAILILDEATSSLDNTTEILIQQALDEFCKGRTTLVVAHRLSTIKNADEIAVISGGEIVEKGTHEQLMEQNGIYANLYKLQFRSSDSTDTAIIGF